MKDAESGDAVAQNNLGWRYQNGDGITRDYKKSAHWYLKAAEQGNVRAQTNLGVGYYKGTLFYRDYYAAVGWYTKAAEQGNQNAQYNLGYCYEFNQGTKWDYEKALDLYKKSAAQGSDLAKKRIPEVTKKLKYEKSILGRIFGNKFKRNEWNTDFSQVSLKIYFPIVCTVLASVFYLTFALMDAPALFLVVILLGIVIMSVIFIKKLFKFRQFASIILVALFCFGNVFFSRGNFPEYMQAITTIGTPKRIPQAGDTAVARSNTHLVRHYENQSILGTIRKGDTVYITGSPVGDWTPVNYQADYGNEGWVLTRLITLQPRADGQVASAQTPAPTTQPPQQTAQTNPAAEVALAAAPATTTASVSAFAVGDFVFAEWTRDDFYLAVIDRLDSDSDAFVIFYDRTTRTYPRFGSFDDMVRTRNAIGNTDLGISGPLEILDRNGTQVQVRFQDGRTETIPWEQIIFTTER
jgi:hypothetical protein